MYNDFIEFIKLIIIYNIIIKTSGFFPTHEMIFKFVDVTAPYIIVRTIYY